MSTEGHQANDSSSPERSGRGFFSGLLQWFSCERYTESASRLLDNTELSTYEFCRYKFHYYLCYSCRRFLRQIKSIEHSCALLGERGCESLSIQERESMKRSVDDQVGSLPEV